MKITKRERLFKRIENHLRIASRQLVKFDSVEETLQYLLDSFRSELSCDFVCIILRQGEELIPKVSSGGSVNFIKSFPLKASDCSPNLLTKSLTFENKRVEKDCQFSNLLLDEQITTWFTVPLKEGDNHFGFCVIGFTTAVPLFVEMGEIFDEFGKDVAVAISLAKRKEAQKQKIMGLEWLSQNLYLDSLESVVEKIVERAGRATHAKSACIYIYDERNNCFIFQPPAFGNTSRPQKILIENDYVLKNYFPFLETPGGSELTVPLVVNLKTIGVLHIENKDSGFFTGDDLEILEILSNHVAALVENVRLYKNEKDHKQQFHSLLEYQQSLIKETVEQDSFDGITTALGNLLGKSVILFNRFMNPISYHLQNSNMYDMDRLFGQFSEAVLNDKKINIVIPLLNRDSVSFKIWPVNGGGDLLGYLATEMSDHEFPEFQRISIELSLNVYSVQFIKQKLVFDAREQVKDSVINKLLAEKIEDPDSIYQYASLFNWDLRKKYRVSVLSVHLFEHELKDLNILEQQAKKSWIWDLLKARIQIFDRNIIISVKGDDYILILPAEQEGVLSKEYWERLYQSLKTWRDREKIPCDIFIGIGGKAKDLHEYFPSYLQGVKALHLVYSRFQTLGIALFEELGSYTLLSHLKEREVNLFIRKHLEPLLQYSDQKNADLFSTLRAYLDCNGNIKETANALYIHRSTLLYRIEKIQSLLEADLNDSEQRFNLMMAYKLYDLYRFHSS